MTNLDPDQIVWLQIDDQIGYWITVEQFHSVARSQSDYALAG
ncbi:hypothetical protein nbrc107696_23890 [Gordonia spumicola]|uniref:Uncharacterized protein n=1 Tax=Gordonia spumicola TaxID=589161 RepID=A0A7I9VA38_9ACTN|nr:hypothetical protein [Gordonia spumicola]GEE01943.1 hypothetical protein nbrc107696_23890 [Gordonia spumicola]